MTISTLFCAGMPPVQRFTKVEYQMCILFSMNMLQFYYQKGVSKAQTLIIFT